MIDLGKKRDYTSILMVFICTLVLVLSQTTTYAQDNFVVVLDAGHGGKDPGRPAKNFSEKDIALNIVLKLGDKLKDHFYDNPDVKDQLRSMKENIVEGKVGSYQAGNLLLDTYFRSLKNK